MVEHLVGKQKYNVQKPTNYATIFHSPFISNTVISLFGNQYFLPFQSCIQVTFKFSQILNNFFGERSIQKTGDLSIFCRKFKTL